MAMVGAIFLVAAQTLVVTTLAQGTDSGIAEPRLVVVRTAAEWQSVWSAHGRGPLPAVDFTQSMVVGVFAGARATAGFRVTIESVIVEDEVVRVRHREERPNPDDPVAQILTAPFHLVTIPTSDRRVVFESR